MQQYHIAVKTRFTRYFLDFFVTQAATLQEAIDNAKKKWDDREGQYYLYEEIFTLEFCI